MVPDVKFHGKRHRAQFPALVPRHQLIYGGFGVIAHLWSGISSFIGGWHGEWADSSGSYSFNLCASTRPTKSPLTLFISISERRDVFIVASGMFAAIAAFMTAAYPSCTSTLVMS